MKTRRLDVEVTLTSRLTAISTSILLGRANIPFPVPLSPSTTPINSSNPPSLSIIFSTFPTHSFNPTSFPPHDAPARRMNSIALVWEIETRESRAERSRREVCWMVVVVRVLTRVSEDEGEREEGRSVRVVEEVKVGADAKTKMRRSYQFQSEGRIEES